MWDFIREYQFVIGALSGSLAAYLLGLLVSFLRRERKRLGFATSNRTIVEVGHPKLSLSYENKKITRLDSHSVVVRNIGNRALKNLPVRFQCGKDAELLDHEIQAPPGAKFSTSCDGKNALVVDCTLLNPGEVFSVGLTVGNDTSGMLDVTARDENLSCSRIEPSAPSSELIEIFANSSSFLRVYVEFARAFARLISR